MCAESGLQAQVVVVAAPTEGGQTLQNRYPKTRTVDDGDARNKANTMSTKVASRYRYRL
jgi:hypothetical protein